MDNLISRQAAIDSIRETSPAFFSAYQHDIYIDKQDAIARLIALPSVQPERKNGKKFIEIVVTHLVNCPYPEYKGKPYFSIRYEENGKKIEGFGTYKPEVLSKYIREYFMGAEKGMWVRDEFGSKCPCCGLYAYRDEWGDPWESNFCPNCGAELEGTEDV